MTKKVKRIRDSNRLINVNGQFIAKTRVCTNCKKIIELNKGLCPECFLLKLQGKKVIEKHKKVRKK